MNRKVFQQAGACLGVALLATAAHAQITFDGELTEPEWGAALAIQTVQTQFGDNNDANVVGANGSELNALHAYNDGDYLYIGITANSETNGNQNQIFIEIDGAAGGQNVIPAGGFGSVVGLTLPTGFAPQMFLSPNAGGGDIFMNIHRLTSGSKESQFLGSAAAPSGAITADLDHWSFPGSDSVSFPIALDNSNVDGVEAGGGAATGDASAVTTGWEIGIPLAVLEEINGGPIADETDIRIMVVHTNGSADFLSNQVLPPVSPQGNLGAPGTVNLETAGATFATYEFAEVIPASPSTRTVDGVGVDPGTFVTLADALNDLAGSADDGDGEVDTIEIVVDTVETDHIAISFSDPIVINGNDNVIVLTSSAVTGGVGITVTNSDDSSLTINDLTIIPEYDTAGGETTFPGAAMRILDGGVTFDSSVLLDNIVITGSTVGDTPVDPTTAPPADITRFVFGTSPIFAGGIRVDATADGADNTVTIIDSAVSHTASRGIYAAHQSGLTLTTERVQTFYNSGVGLRTFGMQGNWNVIDCDSQFNGDHGFALAGLTAGATSALVNISGGTFSNNLGAGYGIDLASAATVTIDNVEIIGNANRGLRYSNSNGLVGVSLTNTIIADNGSFGIDINEIDLANSFQAPGSFDNLIIANNGSISATPANVSMGATFSATPGNEPTITVSNVTFHNPGGDQADAFIARNFDHRFGSDQIWEFVDCIFSGNDGDDDFAFVVRNAPDRNITINVSNSAIVAEGDHALAATVSNPDSNPFTLTETDVISNDPGFVDAGAGDFDVQNFAYAAAGTDFSRLTGGASFAGVLKNNNDDLGSLAQALADDDDLNGVLGSLLSGGFLAGTPGDNLAELTDGTNASTDGSNLNGLLADNPGEGNPSASIAYDLAGDATNVATLTNLSVISGWQDGRAAHHYDLYTTSDYPVDGTAAWTPLILGVAPITFGVDGHPNPGPGNLEYYQTVLEDQVEGTLAENITGIRIDFYAIGNTANGFVDQWNSGHPNDVDGAPAAVQGAWIREIDANFTVTPVTSVDEWMLLHN